MKTINEIEKRLEESKRHTGVMEVYYQGRTAAFAEAVKILKEEV